MAAKVEQVVSVYLQAALLVNSQVGISLFLLMAAKQSSSKVVFAYLRAVLLVNNQVM